MKRTVIAIASLFVLSVVLAGCGSDNAGPAPAVDPAKSKNVRGAGVNAGDSVEAKL